MRAFKRLFGYDTNLPKETQPNEFTATDTTAGNPEANIHEVGMDGHESNLPIKFITRHFTREQRDEFDRKIQLPKGPAKGQVAHFDEKHQTSKQCNEFVRRTQLELDAAKRRLAHCDEQHQSRMINMIDDAAAAADADLQQDIAHIFDPELGEELTHIYHACDDAISNKLTASSAEGKKMLIVIGEDHFQRKSFLVELVILKLAEKYGIKICAAEISEKLLASIRSLPDSYLKKIPNFSFVMSFLDKQRMNVIAADPDHTLSFEKRNDNMKKIVSTLQAHAIMIVGARHIVSIASDPLIISRFTVLPINAMNVTDKNRNKVRSRLPDSQHAVFNLILNPEYAVQATINVDFSGVIRRSNLKLFDNLLTYMSKNLNPGKKEPEESIRPVNLSLPVAAPLVVEGNHGFFAQRDHSDEPTQQPEDASWMSLDLD